MSPLPKPSALHCQQACEISLTSLRLHKSIAALVIALKWLNNFQGDFVLDVAELDCILKTRKRNYTIVKMSPNSLGLLILSLSILRCVRENGWWDEVPECFQRGVSGFDSLSEIRSAVPFFHYRSRDQTCKSRVFSREVIRRVTYQITAFKWQTSHTTASLSSYFNLWYQLIPKFSSLWSASFWAAPIAEI